MTAPPEEQVQVQRKGSFVSNLLSVLSPSATGANIRKSTRKAKKLSKKSRSRSASSEDSSGDAPSSPSGKLVRPGWSRTPPPSARSTMSVMSAIGGDPGGPGVTIEDIAVSVFGTFEERTVEKKEMLQKRRPEKKHGRFEYKKKIEFQESEVKRLATGLKTQYSLLENFIGRCMQHEQEHLNNAGNAEKVMKAAEKCERTLKTKIKKLNLEVKTLKTEIKSKTAKASKVSRDIAEANRVVDDLKSQLGDVRERLENASSEKQIAETAQKSLEQENAELKIRLQKLEGDLSHKEEITAQQLSGLKDSLAAASAKLEVCEKENASLKGTYGEKTEKLEKEVAEQRDELRTAKASLEIATMEKKSLQERLTSAELKLNSKDTNFEKMLETMQSNQTFIATLSSDKNSMQQQISQLSAENAESGKQIVNLTNDKENLAKDLAAMTKKEAEASAKAETLEEASGVLKSDLEKEKATVAAAHDAHDKLKVENTGLHIELGKTKSTYQEEKEAWDQCKEELTAAKASLEASVSELKEQNATYESELKTIQKTTGISNSEQLKRLQEVSKEAEQLKRKLSNKSATSREVSELRQRLSDLEEKLAKSDAMRRKIHNKLQELRGNVRVAARIRPQFHAEEDADIEGFSMDTDIDGTKVALSLPPSKGEMRSRNEQLHHNFKFNRVFDETCTQINVFDEVSSFVQSSLDGFHVSIFSYGQTGSGKTYTMTGNGSAKGRGIIPRAVHQVLEAAHEARSKGWEYTIKTAYLEIYNETIRDLLADPNADGPKLEIRTSASQLEDRVSGLTIEPVERADEIDHVLERALQNRSVAATDSNEHSSRSHSVFTMYLSGTNKSKGVTMSGSLSMCDLAGSERLDKSKAKGDRLKETQAINKSLSSLADVFSALHKKSSHVPFRNSKLTHLLQPSLSGQGKAFMLVNLSSDASDAGESLCSLRFAKQVNQTELGQAKRTISKAAPGLHVSTASSEEEEASVSRIPGPSRERSGTRGLSNSRGRTGSKSIKPPRRGKSSPPAGSSATASNFGIKRTTRRK